MIELLYDKQVEVKKASLKGIFRSLDYFSDFLVTSRIQNIIKEMTLTEKENLTLENSH